jgi:hypothetical protein
MATLTPTDSLSLDAGQKHLPRDYDMHDPEDDRKNWPKLADNLAVCEQIIRPVYDEADTRAMRHQRWHKWMTTLAATAGTCAVVFAIIHLAMPRAAHWLDSWELVFIIVAGLSVSLGVVLGCHSHWLTQRNKAERCRFLKFRFLIQPALWSGKEEAAQKCREELDRELQALKDLTHPSQMEEWARTESLMDLLSTHEHGLAAAGVLDELMDYYMQKRILPQLDFFERRIRRNEFLDRITSHWPFWLFYASVTFALIHFILSYLQEHSASGDEGGLVRLFVVMAASTPVLGAGVSTLRTAHQFAFNKNRYHHCKDALERLRAHMGKEIPPEIRYRDFVTCEAKLEAEHRNWLHLMTTAHGY